MHLGFKHRRFDLAFDVENLFDAKVRAAQFATTGRLQNEPAIGGVVPTGFACGARGRLAPAPAGAGPGTFQGCEDVHYTPAYPLTLRVMATMFID